MLTRTIQVGLILCHLGLGRTLVDGVKLLAPEVGSNPGRSFTNPVDVEFIIFFIDKRLSATLVGKNVLHQSLDKLQILVNINCIEVLNFTVSYNGTIY